MILLFFSETLILIIKYSQIHSYVKILYRYLLIYVYLYKYLVTNVGRVRENTKCSFKLSAIQEFAVGLPTNCGRAIELTINCIGFHSYSYIYTH